MSPPEKNILLILEKIKNTNIELQELKQALAQQAGFKKLFSSSKKDQVKHLEALLNNYQVRLDIDIKNELLVSDPVFKKLAEINSGLLVSEKFELRLLAREYTEQSLRAVPFMSKDYHYMPLSFHGETDEQGILQYHPGHFNSAGLMQTGRGIATLLEGKIGFMGASHLLVTDMEPGLRLPYRYSGAIDKEGNLQLRLIPEKYFISGMPMFYTGFTGGPFEKEKQKGADFLQNKKQLKQIFDLYKTSVME